MALKVEQVEEAIREAQGNVSAAARALGVDRSTVHRKIQKSARLQVARDNSRETVLDDIETTLEQQALDGNTTAAIFILKTRAKNRGYVERIEQQTEGELTIKVQYEGDGGW